MTTTRITFKHLENKVNHLNCITGNPTEYWNASNDKINVGHYTISGAYGGYELQQISNSSGGVDLPIYTGHISKPKLYEILDTYIKGIIKGIELGKDNKNVQTR